MKDQNETQFSGKGVLVRIYWMFVGNLLPFFLLVLIVEKQAPFPSLLDFAYWIALASLIVVRYVDIRFLNGQTGEGTPATMGHWRRYSRIIAVAGVSTWFLARIAEHFLR